MNCFQLVKSVLDEAYQEIEGTEKDRDRLISQKIAHLKELYSDISSAHDIPYDDPITRFAYIYKYVTSHANIVYQLIQQTPTSITKLFYNDSLIVTCLGGGPGSDFVGMMKYAEKHDYRPKILCHILDKEVTWSNCWSDIALKLDSNFVFSANFLSVDICGDNSIINHPKYLNADLFTMIYFLSEIDNVRKDAEANLDHLFSEMKSGALVLYVDNRNQRYYGFFDQLITKNGLEIISKRNEQLQMPVDEEKTDLGEYFSKFGPPKLNADVAWRIARKL